MISEETIQRVKERARVSELVQEIVPLRRSGGRLVALCPFHKERTPSFHIRDDDKSYYCFGCGATGSVFTFIMEHRGLSFPEAVEELAARYHIPVKYISRVNKVTRGIGAKNQLYEINSQALSFFLNNERPLEVTSYLKERGISEEMQRLFSIGFSGTDPKGLLKFLRSKGFKDEDILKSGLVRKYERGELYDLFRNRLIFPIFIDPKRVVAFGGRTIPSLIPEEKREFVPKYINSPETEVYEKRRVLYGLPQAASAIRDRRHVYVVEGYLDVVGLAQVGIHDVVATCGTALTVDQITRMMRLTKRITVLFDGDNAGRTAAGRSFENFLNAPVDVTAVFLPEGEDPDSIAKKHGKATREFLEKLPPKSLFECYVDSILFRERVKSVSDLGANALSLIAREAASLASKIKDPIVKLKTFEQLKDRFRIDADLASLLTETGRTEIGVEEKLPFDSLKPITKDLLYSIMGARIPERALRNPEVMQAIEPVARSFVMEFAELLKLEVAKEGVLALLKERGPSWVKAWKHAHEMAKMVDLNESYELSVKALIRRNLTDHLGFLESQIKSAKTEEDKIILAQELVTLRRELSAQTD
jgi:DNA primase